MTRSTRTHWLIPTALIALSIVPIAAGITRLVWLASGVEITPENARFFADPVPVVTHIVSVILFSILGAFQFSSGVRRQRPDWHRIAGRLLVPCGLVAALSGLWLTEFYPPTENDGPLLYVFRVAFGWAMVLCLILGMSTIVQRDIAQHRAWMMRSYAIGLGAGTQAFTFILWFVLVGSPDELARALLMGTGWIINVTVVEWILRIRPLQSTRYLGAAATETAG